MDASQILSATLAGTGGGWTIVRLIPARWLAADVRPFVAMLLGFGLAVLVGILTGADWRAALAQAIGGGLGSVGLDQGIKYAPGGVDRLRG